MLLSRSRVRSVFVAGTLLTVALAWITAHATDRARFLIDINPRKPQDQPRAETNGGGGTGFAAVAAEQLRLGCDPRAQASAGRNPFADTVIGRLNPAIDASPEQRRAVIAATISQDFDYAFEQTAALRTSPDPGIGYLGWLVPAYVLVKAQPSNYVQELKRLLPELEKTGSVATFSSADLHYLAAVMMAAEGRTEQARSRIETALEQEPTFYNAILFGLRLRLLSMHSVLGNYRNCKAGFDELFEDLLALVGLTRCPLQASQSEVYLRRFLGDPMRHPAFLAAQVYLGLIARKPRHANNALARFDALPAFSCRASVSRELHRLLEQGRAMLVEEQKR
ncbi:hypothetical protein [Candidatus Thiosymbion oneisti]|uniref:hypothetical protein n=1 Tax=Candidatus Thiosymbion oneisti TaxID=589554 RepID=UPI00105CCC13|nr:hypothetical protein [Candidatus Thiosymbion oneisti]